MNEPAEKIAAIDQRILRFIQSGVDNRDEEAFNRLALDVFELQYTRIPLYRGYCDKRNADPKTVASWRDIPAVATAVFKVADLSLMPDRISKTFVTSGTTDPEERGRVSYDAGGLRLMDATIEAAASAFLFPDGLTTRLMVIAPSPETAPNMVMAYGMNRLIRGFGRPESKFLVSERGFEIEAMKIELAQCQDGAIPVTLCGGSSGFVNFFDYCENNGLRFSLPAGSRCLDAGGFKGKSREVTRAQFVDLCRIFLDIPDTHCVNLLGMTEIASQFYDNTLRNAHTGVAGQTLKCNPPWTRTEVVDPDTLTPLPHGEVGILKHLDLANRGHIIAIQTDDVGRQLEDGFEILGRSGAGEARGCSLTIDEMTRVTP